MTSSIARIEAYQFRSDVREPVMTSFGTIPWRSALLLRVEDSDGAEGWGEIWCNFPPYSADNKMNLVDTVIAPAALGIVGDVLREAQRSLARTDGQDPSLGLAER